MFLKKSLSIFLFLLLAIAWGQDNRQAKLEAQRKQLRAEIKQINTLLFTNKKQKKNALTEIEDLAVKIGLRQRLIKVTNEEANRLTQQISVNQRTITRQEKELKDLKADYAEMIRYAYASKSAKSRLMFLFSSESFLQAYKRFQYLKQYAAFRKKQGLMIAEKTKALEALNVSLAIQKQKKDTLIKENRIAQNELTGERLEQKERITALKKNERSLSRQIQKKQRQIAAFDKEIQRLIRAAITASNKAAAGKNKAVFTLTPEAQLIGKNFTANKGKLPWPVEQGVVTLGFGTQTHPVVKTTKIQSNGVTIATPGNAKVRSVFKGKVMQVFSFKGSNPGVLIQHGNYITSYSNLAVVYVKKGETIDAKQAIGEVFTHPTSGKSELKFSVFQNTTPVNPKSWVYRM
ncbi:MAG: peptidoglycan DD-metalloendopeptidase family protein [Flavobacteriaceae bacterium]|nr:peptidoglycan DD-metalloendopeptidase family protein [Flavobacteriaceae bacterium]